MDNRPQLSSNETGPSRERNLVGWVGLLLSLGAWGFGGGMVVMMLAFMGISLFVGFEGIFGFGMFAMVAVFLLFLAGAASVIAGLICGLMGLSRAYARRNPARIAVALSATYIIVTAALILLSRIR
jgi:hypothetical protein